MLTKLQNICAYIHMNFLYPFIYQWTFRLFSYLGFSEWCWNEHGSENIFSRYGFHLDIYSESKVVHNDHNNVVLSLIFWGTSITFSLYPHQLASLPTIRAWDEISQTQNVKWCLNTYMEFELKVVNYVRYWIWQVPLVLWIFYSIFMHQIIKLYVVSIYNFKL